ncbi:hypothetical protein RWV98_15440 [Agathobaculum sp. NTUH-O15-33]|uniref:hypothetical protein n=1 Tax=Agathobaculum sp. NTUH-O15-33 TaxID=3079302 RepID=UPI002958B9A7|nr:hypothetical protein [Agathobaculum sp. NTUH-O15-33]WNX83960.1 hypothetical protein RWV98_15440 [Agathobaculum sp. NTUH-O15-33]
MKKRLLCAISAAVVLASAAPAACAADVTAQTPSVETTTSAAEVTPRADVIVTKTRVLGGRVQYRRWNETRGYWVDPEWIYL